MNLQSFFDEMEKISAKKHMSATEFAKDPLKAYAQSSEERGTRMESKGKTVRNIAYPTAAALLAGSFIPGIRKSNLARRLMRTGSAGGAFTSTLDAMEINFLSERCLVTQAANNFVLFKGV